MIYRFSWNALAPRKALPVSLFDIHSQLTPLQTIPVSLFDIHSQLTLGKGSNSYIIIYTEVSLEWVGQQI
jgi:hypothetical protein